MTDTTVQTEAPGRGRARQTPAERLVDAHVGGRVRLRRKMLGMSQTSLAQSLGIAFQQIQKYERGTNRISASVLYEIASTLGVQVEYFFAGLEGAPANAQSALTEIPPNVETIRLITAFSRIPDAAIRRDILALAKALADAE